MVVSAMFKIALDAGHGYYTSGKRCLRSIDKSETREWVLNSRIADKAQELFKRYECETMRVDDVTGETDVPLKDRVNAANKANADVYASIHHNAGINGGSGGGIVIYVAPNASDRSIQLQKAVYEHAVANTGLRGNRSTPLATASHYVTRNTKMPAFLGEFGFMDSTRDTPQILTEEFADQIADGIVAAIVEVYGLQKRAKETCGMTQEQFDKMMDNYLARRAEKQPSSWAAIAVAYAKEEGITDGSRPQAWATREEVVMMISNAKK
jgi:N-acetylmuramoyl-L-alanine amidase